MNNSTINAAINLIIVYLYISVLVTITQEWIAQLLALRSKTLRSGIGTLLNDPDVVGLAHSLLNHGLITGISSNSQGPSYIPSQTFASALLDVVAPNQPGGPPNVFASVRSDIAAMPSDGPLGKVRTSLLALADNAQGDLTKLHDQIAAWFDVAMDRVSGGYKRYAQGVMLIVGVVLAIALNADTFSIARSGAAAQPTTINLQAVDPSSIQNGLKSAQELGQAIQPLPLGWWDPHKGWETPGSCLGWVDKVLGLLITGLMVSLGAPFWFDLLDNLMNIRASGPRPAKSIDPTSATQ